MGLRPKRQPITPFCLRIKPSVTRIVNQLVVVLAEFLSQPFERLEDLLAGSIAQQGNGITICLIEDAGDTLRIGTRAAERRLVAVIVIPDDQGVEGAKIEIAATVWPHRILRISCLPKWDLGFYGKIG